MGRKSKMINVKPLHSSWKKKQKDKMEKKLLKAYARELKESADKEKEVSQTKPTLLDVAVRTVNYST